MFGHFYNNSVRKLVVGFGTLFNEIDVKRFNADDTVKETLRVPLGYGPKEKFLVRLDQQPDLDDREFAIVLPRMGFEIAGLQYDPTRKLTRVNKFKKVHTRTGATGKQMDFNYTPVPYNINYNLFIFISFDIY